MFFYRINTQPFSYCIKKIFVASPKPLLAEFKSRWGKKLKELLAFVIYTTASLSVKMRLLIFVDKNDRHTGNS
jgi:hypothetical protein